MLFRSTQEKRTHVRLFWSNRSRHSSFLARNANENPSSETSRPLATSSLARPLRGLTYSSPEIHEVDLWQVIKKKKNRNCWVLWQISTRTCLLCGGNLSSRAFCLVRPQVFRFGKNFANLTWWGRHIFEKSSQTMAITAATVNACQRNMKKRYAREVQF